MYFLFNEFNFREELSLIIVLYLLLLLTTIIFWVLGVYNLLKSYNDLYKGYSYDGFPNATFLKDDFIQLKAYYEENKDNLNPETTLNSLVEDNLEIVLTNCLITNVYNNDRKSVYLHKAKIHMINCVIVIFITSLFFAINHAKNENNKIQQIEIINLNNNNMTSPKLPVAAPPKPPQPRVLKENQLPKPQIKTTSINKS
jgi:hypothetical protein